MENLRLRCPYFYDVALALHATDGAPSVADLVISTFRSRYKVSQPAPMHIICSLMPLLQHHLHVVPAGIALVAKKDR